MFGQPIRWHVVGGDPSQPGSGLDRLSQIGDVQRNALLGQIPTTFAAVLLQ